ncbi:hypothetical protein C7T35_02290 [Variovorax sp. WS11]|uniref:hypothetical protein n=1 Tax=Variovorax sp. WS11 TaxID=1105204 RepID=UPI000D0DC0D4|nr:hypothetical protein [Variovorax sp. WS11]NDZ16867.1 hypothetical protein [Variovorax sp. WS11]PSL86298.1 hypothetical protein C7T35_02290 [Variovorax sp. WS11]
MQHLRLHAAVLLWALLSAAAASAAPAQATVSNDTHTTACAEEDNVSLNLDGARIRRFRVEALPPVYLTSIEQDRTAPDFSGCNFDGSTHPTDPRYSFKERRAVLHDGPRWQVVGITLPSFWRPERVPVRVDGRQDRGFHMIQVFAKTGAKPLEAIVMYPSDGYWRIKPLPAPRFGDGVYGSSFVMGPVEQAGRPMTRIASIAIDTKPLAFKLLFANGGEAKVDVREISEARTTLDVAMKPGRGQGARFAVLRSMYVAPDNADMSEVAWRTVPNAAEERKPLPEVKTLQAADVRFGRSIPSRHNTSAPDIRFGGFATGAR